MNHSAEAYNESERRVLERHFTNTDGPVFGLVDLPETVKGALFARYSRYGGTLRRLFLDEFADSVEPSAVGRLEEGERAARLYDSVFVGFGDDSIAQLGGAHVACEWCSNVLTKILQRPRVASYLEQSTRYIRYDVPGHGGRYRYYSDGEFGDGYDDAMQHLFRTYSAGLECVGAWLEDAYPDSGKEPRSARTRAIRAKSLDVMRGLLPASSLSHVGIYASGQTYEQMVLHLLAHPLPEAQRYGRLLHHELNKIIPSFMKRIDRPDRGGRWVEFLQQRLRAADQAVAALELNGSASDVESGVRLLRFEGSEIDLLCALLFEASSLGEEEIRAAVSTLDSAQRIELVRELAGDRTNRRHRPGRGYEALRYRFEIVCDYGAFRDLQRHRMLTTQWQTLAPDLGADIPDEVTACGFADQYERALEMSRTAYAALVDQGRADLASYAVCLGYKLRFVLDLTAREAMHVIELRSERQGHPSYRHVAQEMYRRIHEVHPTVAETMEFVDLGEEPRLERLLAEIRNDGLADAA